MAKYIKLFAVCFLLAAGISFAQEDVNSVLDYTLRYRGLTRGDITIPIEFFSAAEKSPTNNSKLILPLVKDMMVNPLRCMTWLDSTSALTDYELKDLVEKMFQYTDFSAPNTVFNPDVSLNAGNIAEYSSAIMEFVKQANRSEDKLLSIYSKDEVKFLNRNLFSIFEDAENEDPANFDIFKFNRARDSSIAISKRTMDLLARLDKNSIYKNSKLQFEFCYKLYELLKPGKKLSGELKHIDNKYVQGDFYYYYDNGGIRIAIGGPGKNTYNGKFDFIIDEGGDDVYNIERPDTIGNNFSCIIDLGGNDYYRTTSKFALAGGLFTSGFIFDKEGDDTYIAGNGGLGAAIGGLGLLYDEGGNDTYRGISFCEGAGCFGAGLLVDRSGNDVYIANSYSQGFGMTQGIGVIVDNKGNDSYLVDSRSLDIGRYNDHYISMCQGFGLGLRPYYAGGIGLIIEGEGNDTYNTDIFGQGAAYWYSLGAIVDKSGHDKYTSYQYSQGAGIHLAIGLLKDYDGWDFYTSDGVSQGCGHDFGFGMLWDVKGNDNYSAYSLSQGAGNANGIGILIDESGSDGYLNKYPGDTRGYGNPRREFGSLGIFMDMSGDDFYSVSGMDSIISNSSTWGVMNDYPQKDLPEQVSGNNFKVSVDSINPPNSSGFSIDDYFIMAKTIEPRFSLYQEYGFRKLIEDSAKTAAYILAKLGSEDHRETLVLRNLSRAIETPISGALITRLNNYLADKSSMTQAEVSFACYIFGETGNPSGKDILLKLTYDDNYKTRSSAINALGKIKYDTNDIDFKNRVSGRLTECAGERSDKKLYNKDIAFAFGNYNIETNIPILIRLMDYPYYGVRFLAAEDLKNYGDKYYSYINDALIENAVNNYRLNPFLYSIGNLSEKNFRNVIERLESSGSPVDEITAGNLIEAIKLRKSKSSEPGFLNWCDKELPELQNKIRQKVR
jgi:hypothetical protein